MFFRLPNYWVPNLKETIVYSEILNEYLNVTVTERTLRLIDEKCGFDNYILGVSYIYGNTEKMLLILRIIYDIILISNSLYFYFRHQYRI